jgi:hypothetical protein
LEGKTVDLALGNSQIVTLKNMVEVKFKLKGIMETYKAEFYVHDVVAYPFILGNEF